MDPVLIGSYVVHVASAILWVGATMYAAYAVFPPAMDGQLSVSAFERAVDGLLATTRWTGIALPVTGIYQIWVLYPLDALFGTVGGWLVVSMLGLWSVMNGTIELGVYRMRTADGESLGFGQYMAEGYVADGGVAVRELAEIGWPYLLASVGMGVLLCVDAGLLAAGVV